MTTAMKTPVAGSGPKKQHLQGDNNATGKTKPTITELQISAAYKAGASTPPKLLESALPSHKTHRAASTTSKDITASAKAYYRNVTISHHRSFTLKAVYMTEGPLKGRYVLAVEPQSFRFLDLIPELRNYIYDTLYALGNSGHCRSAQLLKVCKQVHQEYGSILYGRMWGFHNPVRFAKDFGDPHTPGLSSLCFLTAIKITSIDQDIGILPQLAMKFEVLKAANKLKSITFGHAWFCVERFPLITTKRHRKYPALVKAVVPFLKDRVAKRTTELKAEEGDLDEDKTKRDVVNVLHVERISCHFCDKCFCGDSSCPNTKDSLNPNGCLPRIDSEGIEAEFRMALGRAMAINGETVNVA